MCFQGRRGFGHAVSFFISSFRGEAQPVVLDEDVLHPFAAGLNRCVQIDGGHQLTQRIAIQFFNTDLLVRFPNELLNAFALSFLYFNLLL